MIKNFFKKLYSSSIEATEGKSYPIGATVYPDGVNFCLYSKNATGVELLLFDKATDSKPLSVIEFDPKVNHTSYYWHAFVPGIKSGQIYGYRLRGPYDPKMGDRFDAGKVLLDPYTRGVITKNYDRAAATMPGDNCALAMKSVVIDTSQYDWEGDEPLNIPLANSIIYEMHVAGFTKNPNSGVPESRRGTYLGIIDKIPYLQSLGITAVELLPIHQFDIYDVPDQSLVNYWGYSPIGFFAPHNGYGTTDDPVQTMIEFRDMVKALHKAGIEVILDVVYNHTAEGGHEGPTLSMRGIENKIYYILENNKRFYKNYSGTGNTLKANHSVVRRFILESLRFWVEEMHVDGFRFDLASILSRDERKGGRMDNSPILWEIESDPVLSKSKIIAEAWDLEQYQLGTFIGDRWAEWNGKFRDDVRGFIVGHEDMMHAFVQRLTGSPDLFIDRTRNPNRSINFITCHDGFTLNDLVSYNEKHNHANGEDNRDGHNHNNSWNHGVEGPTDNDKIETLRLRQIKNFFTVLLFSQGTPMIWMGDEVRRTQLGNNNAYCQDNEISWFDWDLVNENNDLLRFVQSLNKLNREIEFFQENSFWSVPDEVNTSFDLHGTMLNNVNWSKDAHAISFTLYNPKYKKGLHIMINSYWKSLPFELPELAQAKWRLLLNTNNPSPRDIYADRKGPFLRANKYRVGARSIVGLIANE